MSNANLVREVVFSPAYDRRSADPKTNYGIHGVELRFYVKGDKGVVQFVLFTNWQLPHVREEMDLKARVAASCGDKYAFSLMHPLPADLGYHSPKPRYEDQHAMKCDLLPEGQCYYDGSGLNAERIYEVLLREGSAGVWRELEQYYTEVFNGEEE